ncbi:uncharacterized protein L3040_001056 [Drepanopeziza brunnea f. sp. 'multigermtubi']|uniref:uncharacterized protein n=1 Tax=Drepanopeziza brunnea f. sp. 'multigermtubi' TaxID=698441 RepID=UPI0023A29779|nr:hypothetical protein L3040_001056 [Drepanopeziza brunnea f. sp. 'multigermtubi']
MDEEAIAQAQADQLAAFRRQFDDDFISKFLAQDDEMPDIEAQTNAAQREDAPSQVAANPPSHLEGTGANSHVSLHGARPPAGPAKPTIKTRVHARGNGVSLQLTTQVRDLFREEPGPRARSPTAPVPSKLISNTRRGSGTNPALSSTTTRKTSQLSGNRALAPLAPDPNPISKPRASAQANGAAPYVMRREIFSQASRGNGLRPSPTFPMTSNSHSYPQEDDEDLSSMRLDVLVAGQRNGAMPSLATKPTSKPRKSPDKTLKRSAVSGELPDEDTITVTGPVPGGKRPRKAPAKPKTRPSKNKARRGRGKRTSMARKIYSDSEFDGDEFAPTFGSQAMARPARAISNHMNFNDFLEMDEGNGRKKFVIGLDYGTTFTSVSYYTCPENEDNPQALPSDIKNIVNWPDDGMSGMRRQVPTECWYSTIPKTRILPPDQYEIGEWDDKPGVVGPATRPVPRHLDGDANLYNSDEEDDEDFSKFLWGYEVPYHKYEENAARPRDEIRCIERPKLMLVDTAHTQEDRDRLRPKLDHLISQGLIQKYGKRYSPNERDVQDTISDFLIEVFQHTKKQLMETEGLTEECQVSFVMTVPAIWSPRSSRILQYAMEAAIRTTGLGTLGYGSVDNLFIITEPEAAATYLLRKSHEMIAGETFVVLDCGGGTVDAVSYTATDSYPLRLKAEVGKPTGDNCGASYLNVNFEKHILGRLAGEDYLDRKTIDRKSLVRALVPNFENHLKRRIDISSNKSSRLRIPGLMKNVSSAGGKRNLENDFLKIDSDDYKAIFLPLLRRVAAVLRDQIEMVMTKRKVVKKVFLIGGFGAAPSLRTFIGKFLEDFQKEFNLPYEIRLVTTNDQESVTAVASGAVLRALNKQQGPTREANSSFGFLRIEPYNPKYLVGHRRAKAERDEVDGEDYVTVIDYFIVKGTVIPSMHIFTPYTTYHTFEVDEPLFLCEEVLYVSDIATESHYALTDPRNKDAQVAGKIVVDMTFLRDEGRIQPILPPPGPHGVAHYKVEYDLVAVVEGRNLRYEARYPSNSGKVRGTGQVSIAAAFQPGTG